jgi:hypothetical protein
LSSCFWRLTRCLDLSGGGCALAAFLVPCLAPAFVVDELSGFRIVTIALDLGIGGVERRGDRSDKLLILCLVTRLPIVIRRNDGDKVASEDSFLVASSIARSRSFAARRMSGGLFSGRPSSSGSRFARARSVRAAVVALWTGEFGSLARRDGGRRGAVSLAGC